MNLVPRSVAEGVLVEERQEDEALVAVHEQNLSSFPRQLQRGEDACEARAENDHLPRNRHHVRIQLVLNSPQLTSPDRTCVLAKSDNFD